MKEHRIRNIVIKVMIFLLFFSSIPLDAFAQTADKSTEENNNQSLSLNDKKSSLKTGEMIDERTENSKLFYNGNGKFTKQIYFEPIYKENQETNQLEEISADLVTNTASSKEVETENTTIETSFLKEMANGKYATFQYDGHDISYSLVEASGDEKEAVTPTDVKAQFQKNDNKIVHPNVFSQIDLQNLTFGNNVKEDLILHAYNGLHIFTFKLQTDLKAEIQEDGSIQFTDDKNESIFTLPKPFMTDSNYDEAKGESERSDDVTYDLKKIEDGYLLTLNADKNWLTDEKRVYPVYIDPTTSISTSNDTFVMSAYPTTNYSSSSSKWDSGQNQYVLKTGYYDSTTGTNYAFLYQNIDAIQDMNVTSATLNAYVTHAYYPATANGLWVDAVNSSWSSSSVTWNNKPSSTNITNVNVARDEWAKFNVTNMVKDWASGKKENNGFKLHTNGNGQTFWKKIVSATNSNNKPYLSVTYTIPVADPPTGDAYTYGDGTGYVDLSWEPVKGATSYKVWINNGNGFTSFNAGNKTTWSTKGKYVWPTEAEIAKGKIDIHTDGKGEELSVDPSKVYKLSNSNYPTSKKYTFRVMKPLKKSNI